MTDGAFAYSPDGLLTWTKESLVSSAQSAFPGARVLKEEPLTLLVHDDIDDYDFQIDDLSGEVQMLGTDGYRSQQLRFGAWVASLVPEDAIGRVVLLNHDATVAAYLKPGMTPEDVDAAWHEEPPE